MMCDETQAVTARTAREPITIDLIVRIALPGNLSFLLPVFIAPRATFRDDVGLLRHQSVSESEVMQASPVDDR